MKFLLTLSALGLCLGMTACTSNPTSTLAIQKENQQFEVTGLGKSAVISKNNAIIAANKTCGRSTAIVSNEKTEYNGVLKNVVDEKTGQTITAATEVIWGLLGKSSTLQKDDDYQTTLSFSCQK